MKTTLYILVALVMVSCGYNRFEPLELAATEPWTANCAIGELREGTVRGSRIVEGVVVTSDSTGNFYKQFIVTDPETRASICVEAGIYEIYTLYARGEVVAVQLEGLKITKTADGILGVQLPSSLAAVTSAMHSQGRTEPLAPRRVKIAELSAMAAGSYVELCGVTFPKGGMSLFAGEVKVSELPYASAAKSEVTLYTSPYASFANELLPRGELCLRAILLFHNGKPQLKMVDYLDGIKNVN